MNFNTVNLRKLLKAQMSADPNMLPKTMFEIESDVALDLLHYNLREGVRYTACYEAFKVALAETCSAYDPAVYPTRELFAEAVELTQDIFTDWFVNPARGPAVPTRIEFPTRCCVQPTCANTVFLQVFVEKMTGCDCKLIAS
jgi:hypothetical protein